MSNPRPKITMPVIHQVSADTKFHIDYDWWERSTLDLKTYIISRLQALGFDEIQWDIDVDAVDLVDMTTGEVRQVDGFQYIVQTYFNQLPDDYAQKSSLVDAVFCTLMANANRPMTIEAISERIGRSSDVVLRTINGPRIYQGISPIFDE